MARLLFLVIAGAVLAVSQVSRGDVPAPSQREGGLKPLPDARLPAGKWTIKFTNGVIEACEIRKDGTTSVVEPRRASSGKATIEDGSTVLVFEDDRIERWTPVGKRFVVEHWFPGSRFPTGTPVLGIAKRSK